MGIREKINFSDEHVGSALGQLFIRGLIELHEYEAGARYGGIVLSYLKTTDAPEPYGSENLAGLDEDLCFARKMHVAAAKSVLRGIDRRATHVVDRVCVYEQPLDEDKELTLLRVGLRALAGV